jgi:hypothetical protein
VDNEVGEQARAAETRLVGLETVGVQKGVYHHSPFIPPGVEFIKMLKCVVCVQYCGRNRTVFNAWVSFGCSAFDVIVLKSA